MASAGGCRHCAGLRWQLELFCTVRTAKVELVVRDLGYIQLESDLLYCLSSGFKMISKIHKGTLLARAKRALRYGCGLTVGPSILQQCVRLQAVRNARPC